MPNVLVLDRSAAMNGRTLQPHRDAALLEGLRTNVLRAVASAIEPHRRFALIDFPFYPNVGDSLIWVAQIQALRVLKLWPPCYTATLLSYNEKSLRETIGDGVILLQAGGNFGDLYPAIHDLRERIIAAFPRNPIVQLPQSICFRSGVSLERTRRIIGSHPRVTLLLRDHRSHAFARLQFEASCLLCPDIAFVLGRLAPPIDPTVDVLMLKRNDMESTHQVPRQLAKGHVAMDWREETAPRLGAFTRHFDGLLVKYPNWAPLGARLQRLLYEQLARERVAEGAKRLAQGRVVITDRLHGHIMTMLLGIPHVILDSGDGKVRALYESWTRRSSLTAWANSMPEALALADSLLQHQGNG